MKPAFQIFIVILLCSCGTASFCQGVIRGKVINEKDEAVPNASVFIPNSITGTVSGANGAFTLGHIPEGKFTLTISCVGYELLRVPISPDQPKDMYVFRLKLRPRELDSVIVRGYDKNGWSKWGAAFMDAFIGSSGFASQCELLNKDIIRFKYLQEEDIMLAYANRPLIIDNHALGYRITVQLVDFTWYVSKKEVDYQIYCFFTPMEGTERQFGDWKKNREKAYFFSLMYFMRSLYSDDLKNKFEIRRLVRKSNAEKQRVQQLYRDQYAAFADSLGDKKAKEKVILKMVDKSFSKDSAAYYTKVLEQEDNNVLLYPKPLSAKELLQKTDSGTALLSFSDYLVVTNKRKKEPQEYVDYKDSLQHGIPVALSARSLPQFLSTEFVLTQKMPIEITANGYFNNSNLFINGFWSWWEKLATKLPYEYEP